jgi:hypothetical protein
MVAPLAASMPVLGKRAALAPHSLHQLGDCLFEDRNFFRVGAKLGLEFDLGLDLPASGQLGRFLVGEILLPGRLTNLVVAGDSTRNEGRQNRNNDTAPRQHILVREGTKDCAASAG